MKSDLIREGCHLYLGFFVKGKNIKLTREEKEKIVEDVQTPGLGLLLRSMPSFNRYGIEDGNGSKPVKHVSCSHRQTVT